MAYRSTDNSKAAAKEPRTSDKLQKLCHQNPLLNLLGTVSGVGESPPPMSVTTGIYNPLGSSFMNPPDRFIPV